MLYVYADHSSMDYDAFCFVSFRFVSKSATNSGDTDRIKIAFFTSFLQTYLVIVI